MTAHAGALDEGTPPLSMSGGSGRSFDVGCTVRVSHTFGDFSAHVELDGNIALEPGDRVLVHGAAINPPYGEVRTERRVATVTRATWLERNLARLRGELDCLSLLEVGFNDHRDHSLDTTGPEPRNDHSNDRRNP